MSLRDSGNDNGHESGDVGDESRAPDSDGEGRDRGGGDKDRSRDSGGRMSRDGGGRMRAADGGGASGHDGGRESGHGREPGTDRTGNAMVNDGRRGAAAPGRTPDAASETHARTKTDARTRADGDAEPVATDGGAEPVARAHALDEDDGAEAGAQTHAHGDTGPEVETHSAQDADAASGAGTHEGSVTVAAFGSRGDQARSRGDGGPDAPDFLDEVALRRMLHGAVRQIEPDEGALDQLRRAVPARRARRRQAVVGMAAAALLISTAIPAFVHVANSDGSNTANPAIAGHGEQAQGGSGTESGSGTSGKNHGGGTNGQDDGDPGHPVSKSSPSDSGGQVGDGDLVGGVSDPDASAASSPPACGAGQLGVASAQAGAAGVDGTVYGTFRIANVSDTECTVSSGGNVGFQALGSADPAKITVVRHVAGDAAAGLPDPSQEQSTMALKPSAAYEVRFAWVPRDTCPTTGSSPSPTPTEGAGGTGGMGGGTAAGPGSGTGSGDTAVATAAQLGSEDGGGVQDGSIEVTHTPDAGAPVAEARIPDACAGTIYRTGVLAPAM